MPSEPDNLVLILLRDMREQNTAAMEAVVTAMKRIQHVYETLARFQDDVTGLRTEVAGLRTDLRAEVAGLRTELRTEGSELRIEIEGLRTELAFESSGLKAEMAAFRSENHKDLMQIRSEIASLEIQNIARHGETLNLMSRLRHIEQAGE